MTKRSKLIVPDNIARLMTEADRTELGIQLGSEAAKKGEEMVERELQKACESLLMRHNVAYLHLSPRAREKAGWPDLTFVYQGRPYAVELKTATGKLSEDQERVLAQMRSNGWIVEVVRCYARFVEILLGATDGRETDE